MSMTAAINGFTAWSNVRLASSSCPAENILRDIMAGERMKVLLEKITGSAPKRLATLDGLTAAQKVIRVDWFTDALKSSDKLPRSMKVNSKMFSLQSADHVFEVLWELVCSDIYYAWEIAPVFQRHSADLSALIAEPLKVGPHQIAQSSSVQLFYLSSSGKSIVHSFKRKQQQHMNPVKCLTQMINGQLKMTSDGKRLHVKDSKDLIDSRVLCSLVNSLIPGTFTTQVLLNDRWTINLALEAASEVLQVWSRVDSGDLYEDDEMGTCAFLTYFLTSGYQFQQAQAVIGRMEELKREQEDLQNRLQGIQDSPHQPTAPGLGKQRKQVETKLSKILEEVSWVSATYDIEKCSAWVQHAQLVQAKVRQRIAKKMQERFDVITVPRPMTINKLTEILVISLSLTGGNGFYHSDSKETLWPGRKLVARHRDTGEFYGDCSGSEGQKGSMREMLKLHPYEVVEVNPTSYPNYELFFESSSRNKNLKGGSLFLYQVFPGTTWQCQRLLRRAARTGELGTVRKLVLFFKKSRDFVNCTDPETGNTALHLASRHGHFDTALHLLENGAAVNAQNSPGSTPFFLSTQGLHKQLSQLLLEWGADIHLKNKISKTALDLTRNTDLRVFLERKFMEYQELSSGIQRRDVCHLERHLKAHVSGESPMASLRSRCVRGSTLFHVAASLGSMKAVEILLAQHVEANILNASGATPLHMTRDPEIIRVLVEHGGDVNVADRLGNTPLHAMCADVKGQGTVPDCISLLVGYGAALDIENDKGLLPIHCAASHGLTSAIEALLAGEEGRAMREGLEVETETAGPPGLIYLALASNHLGCAKWLADQEFCLQPKEADKLALRILKGPPQGCTQPVEIFEFLLQHGADVNAVSDKGNSPLHLAASLVRIPELTNLLLGAGASVDARNSLEETPLFSACKANNPHTASKLIAAGSDYWVKDYTGSYAFDYIADHREWMDSGFFPEDVRARLKGSLFVLQVTKAVRRSGNEASCKLESFSLKHARDLVKSISQVVKSPKW